MEFDHVRREREKKEREKADKLAYQKRDAEWKKRQQAKKQTNKPMMERLRKDAHEAALSEMSTYNFEEDQEKEEEKGWYTEGGQKRTTSKYQAQSSDYLKSMNLVNKGDAGKAFGKFGNAREQQMRQAQRTSKNIDFNVNNYDIEELAAILNFDQVPINKGIIQRKILDLKRKFQGKKNILEFFDKAEKKLIDNLILINEQTWVDSYNQETSDAAKVLRNQFQQMTKAELESKKNQIINLEKDIIGIPKKPIDQTYQTKPNTQGTKNPLNVNEYIRVVNFDSHYRQILDASSVDCSGIEYAPNKQTRLYTSTNYTVNLSQPLTNVTSIVLDTVQIPNSFYTFTSDYGTNQFTLEFKGNSVPISIEDGEYTPAQLAFALNLQLNALIDASGVLYNMGYFDANAKFTTVPTDISAGLAAGYLPFPLLEFTYNMNQNKMTLNNYDPSGNEAVCKWFDGTDNQVACAAKQVSETPQPGGKADYNLGWLMGFRQTSSIVYSYLYDAAGCRWVYGSNISPTASTTPPVGANTPTIKETFDREQRFYGKTVPPSLVDIYGPKYFILTLDDFNNNKPNKDLISLVDSTTRNFKIPTYFNAQTMNRKYGKGTFQKYDASGVGIPGYECVDVADEGNNERACSTNDLNKDLKSNLTQKQIYTYEQIMLARSQKSINRYTSPNSSDLLARIPMNKDAQQWNKPIFFRNEDKLATQRKYFGPVKLTKFHVKLLNDKGFEVNLNDQDWSFSILVTHMYQY